MTTPLHYEYSDVYLAEHMSRISRGLVVGGLALVAWAIVICAAAFVINLFN